MNNAKITKKDNKIIIEESNGKYSPDPLFPYIKKAAEYRIENPGSLFGKYIAFYSAIQASGGNENIITTETVMTIGLHYNLSKNTIEHCIKELVDLKELIKVKRGIYMINPQHISGGRTAEASRELITRAEAIQQTTNNIQTQNINIVADEKLLKRFLAKNLKSSEE